MSYTNTKKMLSSARQSGFAVGAFNVYNQETIKAAINAAKNSKMPIILQASESAISYAGAKNLADIVKNESKDLQQDVALHLDHGKSVEACINAINAGFSSVMIDLSGLSIEENIKSTKQVVKFAHKKGVTVEAELGELKGTEDNHTSNISHLTCPTDAIRFIKETGVDSLAVSIGTAHGVNKGTTKPQIHYEILEQLSTLLPKDFPLVCHGASSVTNELTKAYILSGGELKKSQGISLIDIKKMATTTPISKINMDTDLRLVFTTALRNSLNNNKTDFNPRTHLLAAQKATEDYITNIICEYLM